MASISKLRALYDTKQADSNSAIVLPPSVSPRATSGVPYSAASSTRRTQSFGNSFLGPTSVLQGSLDQMRARCRDEIRNNPYAASATDNFEAQTVGNGIFPHWNLENKAVKEEIEDKFDRWAKRTQFYVKQATAAREIFEGGEVFCRLHSRPSSWKLPVPLDIELMEGEQCPINFVTSSSTKGNIVSAGIELDSYQRVVAYHMYRVHPGEFGLMSSLSGSMMETVPIPAAHILHAFKPLRAGLLRGVPHLSSVLTLLHEIGKYTDAAVVKKQIQTMFAGFIQTASPNQDILPIDAAATAALPVNTPLSVAVSHIETGTMTELHEGETITFPSLPQDNDIETFLSVCLHQFAAGIGATYESITGDTSKINLSSIRYGKQVMERKVMQFQQNVLTSQLIHPIGVRWLKEAVLSGELVLPFFARKPEIYEDITWRVPAWEFMEPVAEAEASVIRIRSGLSSREAEVAKFGGDAATVDKQQVEDNKRTDEMGLVYDSDGRKAQKGVKLTAAGEEDAGGVSGVKPKESETPSETAKLAPKPPPPVIAPGGPKPKPNGHAAR